MLLVIGILFIIVGLAYAISEKDFGGLFGCLLLGSGFIIYHIYRKNNAENIAMSKQANAIRKAQTKEEKRLRKLRESMTFDERLNYIDERLDIVNERLENVSEEMLEDLKEEE